MQIIAPEPPSLAVALSLAGAIAGCVYLYLSSPSRRTQSKLIHESPASHPILGVLRDLAANSHRFHDWVGDHCQLFNYEPWALRVPGNKTTVIFSTPEAAEEILIKQFDTFPHGDTVNMKLRQFFGKSILTTDGDLWRHQRKTAMRFFTGNTLRHIMVVTMHKNVQQMYDVIDSHQREQQPLDLSSLFLQFTLQTFTEIGLGVDVRMIGSKEPHILEHYVNIGAMTTMKRFGLPNFYWKLTRWLGVGDEGAFWKIRDTTRAWFSQFVHSSLEAAAKRQQEGDKNETKVKSVVELFIEESEEDKEGLRDEDLIDFLLAFVLAAQDTSALGLTWLFYALQEYPEVEARVRSEMHEQLFATGIANADTYLTTEHCQKLVYLEATIREVLRFFTILPSTSREVGEDTEVLGVPLAKGTPVMVYMYGLVRNPKVWGPDAGEFNPSRWIDTKTGELIVVPATKFPTFSVGPRICPGMKLAMLELRVVAANLLNRYRMTLAVPNDGSYEIAIALKMKNPLMVNTVRNVEASA